MLLQKHTLAFSRLKLPLFMSYRVRKTRWGTSWTSCFNKLLCIRVFKWFLHCKTVCGVKTGKSAYSYLKHKCIHFFPHSLMRNFSVIVRFQHEIKESQAFLPRKCIFLIILATFLVVLWCWLFRFSFSDSFLDYLKQENAHWVSGSGEDLTKSRIPCVDNIKGHRIVYYTWHTSFVKSWRILRHLPCSLPEGIRLYSASYHNHGDLWRFCTNSLILENLLKI